MDAFIERYVSMWNEADPAKRRALIEALWTFDGANYTKAAAHHGHDALEKRVTASWEKSVRNAGCLFRARRHDVHHDAVRFVWEMVDANDGRVRAVGTEFLILDKAGLIRSDFQFVE